MRGKFFFSLVLNFGTAGFFGALGLEVVCFGAGGGETLPLTNSKIVASLS